MGLMAATSSSRFPGWALSLARTATFDMARHATAVTLGHVEPERARGARCPTHQAPRRHCPPCHGTFCGGPFPCAPSDCHAVCGGAMTNPDHLYWSSRTTTLWLTQRDRVRSWARCPPAWVTCERAALPVAGVVRRR